MHSLPAQRVDEPGARLVVHRLDEGETAARRIGNPAVTMKRGQALARDRLEPVLLAAADIAAVHANKQRPVRLHVVRAGRSADCFIVDRHALGGRGKRGFVRFGDPEKMPANALHADRTVERQDFVDQPDRQAVGH